MNTTSSVSAISPLGLSETSTDPIAADKIKRDQKFAQLLAAGEEAKHILADATKGGTKGYWEWKIKELRKAITEQVMGKMGLTEEKLAAMSPEERLKIETKIAQIVEEQVRLAMEAEMKRAKQKKLEATTSLQSLITATQDVGKLSQL
jgi:hypothetical protein